jgi:hypothetical protein
MTHVLDDIPISLQGRCTEIQELQMTCVLDDIPISLQGRCTEIQELQMTTVLDENVHNFAVEGSSDDLDVPIKGGTEPLTKFCRLFDTGTIKYSEILFINIRIL